MWVASLRLNCGHVERSLDGIRSLSWPVIPIISACTCQIDAVIVVRVCLYVCACVSASAI